MSGSTVYRVKHITFPLLRDEDGKQTRVAVILQNVNGPCPLIAIYISDFPPHLALALTPHPLLLPCYPPQLLVEVGNVLLLRGQLEIHEDVGAIVEEELLQLLSSHLLSRASTTVRESLFKSEEEQQNFNRNLNDAMSIFPKLTVGLDVNLKFHSCEAFESTLDVLFFELVNIRLVHGWVVDPDHPKYSMIKGHSYNSATEKIVLARSILSAEAKNTFPAESSLPVPPPRASSIPSSTSRAPSSYPPVLSSSTTPVSSSSGPVLDGSENPFLKPISNPFLNGQPSLPLGDDPDTNKVLLEGKALEDFLFMESPTQLTFRGLFEIHRTVQENELCVFFRNNHFSTLLKRNDMLYILLTDEGFKHNENAVWEVLNEISGDSQFVDADFQLYVATSQDTAIEKSLMKSNNESESDLDEPSIDAAEMEELKNLNLTDEEIVKQIELRKSEKLALKLQRQEERKLSQRRTEIADVGIEQDEGSLLRKSEKLALQLQREQEEEESLALARALQEEEEREARVLQDEAMARKLQKQFNKEAARSDSDSDVESDDGGILRSEKSKPKSKSKPTSTSTTPSPRDSSHSHPEPLKETSSKSPRRDKEKSKKKDNDCSLM